MEVEDKLKSLKGSDGSNIYEHFANIIGKIVQDHPKNAYEIFEQYSHYIKQNKYNYTSNENYVDAYKLREKYDEVEQELEKAAKYFNLNPQTAGGDEEAEQGEPPQIGYIPDMMEELQLLERAGLGFGEKETFKIYSSIKKLCQVKGASNMTFWGKIFGLKKDYYVVQAVVEGGEDGEQLPNVEPKGTGVNEKFYFVTTDLMDENSWVELPTITPNHIIQSRRIRHVLTGDLEYDIQTCPKFDGREKDYLKAQIVRISRSTSIWPMNKAQVKKDEDEGADQNPQEIEPFEDEQVPKFGYDEMLDLNSWLHSERGI